MTPYVPHTVWATAPNEAPRVWTVPPPRPTEQRAYKKGALSLIATRVLEYARAYPGTQTKDIKTTLNIASISRQLKCLQADGLITVTRHESRVGKPLVRCWPTDPFPSTQPLEPNRHEEDYPYRQTTTPSHTGP